MSPLLLALGMLVADPSPAAKVPQPGEVYREFILSNGGNLDWRVTDPEATAAGAQQFLPNPVLRLDVKELEGAVRAEAILDRWGGHLRTANMRIRFNQNEWLSVPEISTPPRGRAAYYYSQDHPTVVVPLDHLQQGENRVEGSCGAIDDYNWGQWGLNAIILRVYYDPQRTPHPTGRITYPSNDSMISDHVEIRVDGASPAGVARVDVLAWYEGIDEDGDGVTADWHRAYFQTLRGAPVDIREHVGTAWRSPYRIVWNTHWVPDQPAHGIRLVARIQDSRGQWFVTETVDSLTLDRPDHSVALYGVADFPERFGVRIGQRESCRIPIPDSARLDQFTEAAVVLRTWHGWDGHHEPLDINGWTTPIGGKNHHYDFDLIPVPVGHLKHENVLTIKSKTEHHMLEVLWPGPCVVVRSKRP